MQQPVAQPDQLSNQLSQQAAAAAAQQMMLCPVRLVYETQILVQPGDQIQPNQTIFLNTQNTPPWVQNQVRPVQNQVIYVQQMPHQNFIQQQQQNVEQNQMFLQQNFGNYQHVFQNQLIAQNPQDMRQTFQLANVMPSNILQNVQAGIVPNIQGAPNDRMVQSGQNFAQIQANINPNVSNNSQNINSVNTIANDSNNRPAGNAQPPGPQMMNQQIITHQKPSEIQNMTQCIQRIAQTPQQQQQQQQINIISRPQMPQVMTINPMQPHSIQNQQIIQNMRPQFDQNNGQIRPQFSQVSNQIIPNNIQYYQTAPTNITPNAQARPKMIRNPSSPNVVKPNSPINVSSPNVAKNYNQIYRPIQPRPQQIKTEPNVPRMNIPDQNLIRMQSPMPQQNIVRSNYNIVSQPSNINSISYPNLTGQLPMKSNEISVQISRKRKSESPDEVQRKMPVNIGIQATSMPNTMTSNPSKPFENNILNNTKSSSEIGVNTSPVHRIVAVPTPTTIPMSQQQPITITQINNIHTMPKPELNLQQSVQIEKLPMRPIDQDNKTKDQITGTPALNSDKLVRNTVFPQARGRVLSDKEPTLPSMPLISDSIPTQTMNLPSSSPFSQIKINNNKSDLVKIEKVENNVDIKPELVKNSVKMETESSVKLNKSLDNITSYMDAIKKEKIKTEQINLDKIKQEQMKRKIEQVIKQEKLKEEQKIKEKEEQIKQEKIKEEQIKQEKIKEEQIKQEKIKEEQIKQEKIKEEQIKQEKIKEEQTKDVRIKEESSKPEKVKKEKNKEEKTKAEKIKQEIHEKAKDAVSINDIKGKEIHLADGAVRTEERSNFVLTHVLDGYVIQESNIAFPIRKPLKEKILMPNAQAESKGLKEEVKPKDVIKDNSKILNISHLDLNEKPNFDDIEKKDENCGEAEGNNPFAAIKPTLVKSWTVDDLVAHLDKFDWKETISLLREHEIDGESLFLVSKPQLMTIGVKEDHAEIICEFVKS